MKRIILLICLVLCFFGGGIAQNSKQEAVNSYTKYLTENQKMLQRLLEVCANYYPSAERKKEKSNAFVPLQFTCPIRPENDGQYWYNKAQSLSTQLGAEGNLLKNKLNEVQASFDALTKNARALETYLKLKDYENDNFVESDRLMALFPSLMQTYQKLHIELAQLIEQARLKWLSTNPQLLGIEKTMREIVKAEQSFFTDNAYNLAENALTQDLKEALITQFQATEQRIWQMQKINLQGVNYHAENAIKRFIASLQSIQETRKSLLNEYKYPQRLTDEQANNALKMLHNWYNGGLIADFNLFVQYTGNNVGYYSAEIPYLPLCWKQENTQKTPPTYTPVYKDLSYVPCNPNKRNSIWTNREYEAFLTQTEFLNESIRFFNNMSNALQGAVNFKDFENRGSFYFNYPTFTMPYTEYHKAKLYTQFLPSECQQSLLSQTENLVSLIEEIDKLSLELREQDKQKLYQQDNFKRVSQIRDRLQLLWQHFEDKKELLRSDLFTLFESSPTEKPTESWQRSAQALRKLVLEERKAMLEARAYLHQQNSNLPVTDEINTLLRQLLTDQYDNLKGIEKLGRYNGKCPYTPYEDIAKGGQTFIKAIENLPNKQFAEIHYQYNNTIREYNRFVSLSPHKILPEIYQPDAYFLKENNAKLSPQSQQPTKQNPQNTATNPQKNTTTPQKGINIQRDTVIVYRTDTVYVYQTDTVYLDNSMVDESFYSLEGFATNNIVLLVDVSGSMNTPNRLPLLKESLKKLVSIMRPEDEISIVIYSGKARTALPPTSGREKQKIIAVLDKLTSEGETDAQKGITLAYKVANKNYKRGGNNRIILATDGDFKINTTMVELVKQNAATDIFLSVFNYGGRPSSKLKELSDTGKGYFRHITKDNAEVTLIREAKAKRK